jgi:mono/diheme cytochrome c family protein
MRSRVRRFWYFLPIVIGMTLVGAFLIRCNVLTGEPITINGITVSPLPTLDPELVAQGEPLYAQHCASCHGANLEGVPDWKIIRPDGKLLPPPQDSSGHTWHHPDDLLISVIAEEGDPSYSDMPGFRDVLTEEEMSAVLSFIKNSWGQEEREFQWWITTRDQ